VETVTSIAAARTRRQQEREARRRVALVPTMGALHDGHLSLVRRAAELADSVWVSVFVNPAQFGPNEDLDRYPRDLEADAAKLEAEAVDVLFAPTTQDMYPQQPVITIGFSGLEDRLCGASRPGHFSGVGLVVAKLFNIVQPEVAVFGQKDAQQALLIRRLVEDLDVPVSVEVAPTVREPDGLAMSSRNAYLSGDERRAASAISRALGRGRQAVEQGVRDPRQVRAAMLEVMASESLLELEYAECVSEADLVAPARTEGRLLLAIAARAGTTRLIDNMVVTPPAQAFLAPNRNGG
jgi:pantoate--beta-alanine ligase